MPRRVTVAVALLALLGLEAALLVALVASAQPGDPPDPGPEVRDRRGIVCDNELRPGCGRVQEDGNECPEVDECLWGTGE